ncbi:tyrosine--tRNA ligase [bacterium]|nr:tyrosine--tRNA ligase [bacterium]
MSIEILKDLQQRGLIQDIAAAEELSKLFSSGSVTYYCGFDPTADSLHVGSLLPLVMMKRLAQAGHKPIGIIGTATGMIGDPSGKQAERVLMTADEIQKNAAGIEAQVKSIVGPQVNTVCNGDWCSKLSMLEFLRDVGKHFSVNMMLGKDSVAKRLDDREQGISYTEFSYMLLQAYDFYVLNEKYNCSLQIGGSDQWGNITAGMDFIRRKSGKQAYGMTFPLLTTASGAKFGKTEAGNVWLSSKRTSPYKFYQFWLNTADQDIKRYLNFFSLKSTAEIEKLCSGPVEARLAQKALAEELTILVHGASALTRAQHASSILFGEPLEGVDPELLEEIFSDVPSASIAKSAIHGDGIGIVDLMTQAGATSSKGEARRLVEGGGIMINNNKVSGIDQKIQFQEFIGGKLALIRIGKKRYHLVRVEER